MTLDEKVRTGAHPSMVLSAHIEPLVRGRRVAILGDATIDLAERLTQRGARLVHAYDPDAARTAEAIARSAGRRTAPGPHVSYAVLEGDLGVRDGAFDVVVVPDLSLFADPTDILRRVRRLVAGSGAAVIALPNPEAQGHLIDAPRAAAPKGAAPIGYYDLYDLVSLQFPLVRMLGQAPFVGYTVADFAPKREPSVSFDTSLIDGSASPEWFIAVASERPVSLEEFAVIEVPLADVLSFPRGESPQAEGARSALAEANGRIRALETELEELRKQTRDDGRKDAEARAQTTASTSARLVELEAELEVRDARLKESQSRAGDAHVRAERLVHQIGDLEEEVRRQRDRATKLAKQLDDEKKARTKVEMELAMIRTRPEIAGAKDRLQELSSELEAARARITELEAEHAMEHAATRRIVLSPPDDDSSLPTVVPNPELIGRVASLEIMLQDARHTVEDLTQQRDTADARATELERALGEQERARAAFAADRAAADERRAAAEHRATELERREAKLAQRAEALEKRVAELEAQAKARAADLNAQSETAVEAVAADLAAAEATLRERGHVITALQRDLRESERLGKELIEELEALRSGSDAADAREAVEPPAVSADAQLAHELRTRLDALAGRSAKSEADLQAASWRIAQLERQLEEAQSTNTERPSANLDLERALAAARDEIAALRHALSTAHTAEPPRSAIEQSVLLHQVAGQEK